jgi:predicted RNase H-like nuclease (RuvC/YqgF family)
MKMKKSEFKELLLKVLEDEEVKSAIIEIIKENVSEKEKEIKKLKSECREKENQIETLKNHLQKKDKEIEMLKKLVEKFKNLFNSEKEKKAFLSNELENRSREIQELTHLKNELSKKVDGLNQEIENLKKENEFYKNSFKEELEAYEIYKSLSDETKESLSGIFRDNSLKGFLACGVQDRNISNFYEYVKNEIIEEKNQDIKKLIKLFNFFLDRYLLAFPIYKKQNVKIGDEFDPQLHINLSNAASGKIKKIILFGLENSKTGKIVKKSIVII